jgi:hypothetical protein
VAKPDDWSEAEKILKHIVSGQGPVDADRAASHLQNYVNKNLKVSNYK